MPVAVRFLPREEAMVTRKHKIGTRRVRMAEFDNYVSAVVNSDEGAAIFEDLEEDPKKFVLSLRNAFKRANVDATVRKMRDRNEVRVWLADNDTVDETDFDDEPDEDEEEFDESEDDELEDDPDDED